mgnify:CR=1 FL=1
MKNSISTYLVSLGLQLFVYVFSYQLLYSLIELGANTPFANDSFVHYRSSLQVFFITSAFQWLTLKLLQGKYELQLALVNLLVLCGFIIQNSQWTHSLLLLVCTGISMFVALRLFKKLQEDEETPPSPTTDHNLLDDDWQ